MKDWRSGKTELAGNVSADWTCRSCQKFNFARNKICEGCGAPCPPEIAALPVQAVDGRVGRAAGHFDRPDPEEERNAWNSDDEEYDEFGRKKRSKAGARSGASDAKSRAAAMSEKQKAALERLKQKGKTG
eukprot:CAMPEP_0169391746 /NCGR_PEP_ID=MMETSP1017-20121227/48247_1 /TAXON_ID=342587 /ORGANISM="Karlodinium micrum, Strain CCMP2283" /LENGTH=129 /DNA_ID=CAMNT_0009494635 /DNA_START=50 /DNA_END=436 /DNA_ORIENTATION=-